MNLAYLELKLAWQLHQQPPEELDEKIRLSLRKMAARQQALENLILRSPEAMQAVVSPQMLSQSVAELRGRYPSGPDFLADLQRYGLDEAGIEAQLSRDLRVERTLERVAASVPPVSETEAEIYYRLHPQSFRIPERRQLRHILLTCEGRAESESSRTMLCELRERLGSLDSFSAAALRLSHCPTSLDGGSLGWVRRGQLYRELENVAFALANGEVSQPVQSEMGWHLLRCDAREAGRVLSFAEVREDLMRRMGEQRRESRRRQWVVELGRRLRNDRPAENPVSC